MCDTLKNPHCPMAKSAEHKSKFAALHRQWWRPQMSEKFSSGTKNSKQTNNVPAPFTLYIYMYYFENAVPILCLFFIFKNIWISRNPIYPYCKLPISQPINQQIGNRQSLHQIEPILLNNSSEKMRRILFFYSFHMFSCVRYHIFFICLFLFHSDTQK